MLSSGSREGERDGGKEGERVDLYHEEDSNRAAKSKEIGDGEGETGVGGIDIFKVLKARVGRLSSLHFRVLDDGLLVGEQVEEDHACNYSIDDINALANLMN